jgi:hypothetical protein
MDGIAITCVVVDGVVMDACSSSNQRWQAFRSKAIMRLVINDSKVTIIAVRLRIWRPRLPILTGHVRDLSLCLVFLVLFS